MEEPTYEPMVIRDSLKSTQITLPESNMHVDKLCGELELVHS